MATTIPFFVEGLDGRLINVTLVQNVIINPNDNTNVLWIFKNGRIYEEDLVTSSEADNRLANIKEILLGNYAELVETITEQQQRISELSTELELATNKVDEINNEII